MGTQFWSGDVKQTSKAFFQLVVLDTPQHEDDRGNHSEDEGVGEVTIQWQFYLEQIQQNILHL